MKRFLVEKTKRQQKTKKKEKILKGRQGESNEKTPRDKKKREQVDLGRTRGKIKRQRRHSKRDNVEKVFFW